MPNTAEEKFSSQAAPEIVSALRKIAVSEGRPMQELLDKALRKYIECKEKGQSHCQAMDAFEQSLNEFDQLYRELAK